jgi:hypothetical protein
MKPATTAQIIVTDIDRPLRRGPSAFPCEVAPFLHDKGLLCAEMASQIADKAMPSLD